MQLLSDYNASKEEGLLGLCLSGDQSALNYVRLMSPDYFFSTPHQSVLTAIQRVLLNPDRKDVNITTVSQELIAMPRKDYSGQAKNHYEELGGSDFLIDLVHSPLAIPSETDEIYKDLVNYYLKRTVADVTVDISRVLSRTRIEEVPRLLTNHISHLQDLLAGSVVKGHEDVALLLRDFIDQIERIEKGEEKSSSLDVYLPEMNMAMGSARAGDGIVLLALPGIGKTMLAVEDLWVASCPGVDEDGNVLFTKEGTLAEPGEVVVLWNLDMSEEQLIRRIAAMQGIIPSEALRRDEYTKEDIENARAWFDQEVKYRKFYIISDTRDLDTLLARTYAIHAKTPISRMAIDFFQLLRLNRPTVPVSDRRLNLAECIAILKTFKNETKILTWFISHSKRDIYNRSVKRHTGGDPTETSDIEKLADFMVALLSPYHFDKVDDNGNPNDPDDLIMQWLKGRDKTDKRDIKLRRNPNGKIVSPAAPAALNVPDLQAAPPIPYGDHRLVPKLNDSEDIPF